MSNKSSFNQLLSDSPVPVLVDFWAEWCMPCRTMAPVLEQLSHSHSERVKVVKVNVDKNPAAAERYGVQGIPTLILFEKGREVWRHVGALPYPALEAELTRRLPK